MARTKEYDVAFSYAGEDRPFVQQVANRLSEGGVKVFYDEYEKIRLWGEHLPEVLDRIYRSESRFVVVFISKAYAAKVWTRFEIRSVLAAAINSSVPYLLPARFDDTDLPGVQPSIAYADLRDETPASFAESILRKIHNAEPPQTGATLFRDPGAFHVLLLPFDPIEQVHAKEIKLERAIQKRLLELKEQENLSLEVAYLERGVLPTSFGEGVAAGRKQTAHLVVWGDYYQQLQSDTTKVQLRWALVDVKLPHVTPTGKTAILPVESLTLISEGFLQNDIDYVIFWCLAHMELARARHDRAAVHFESVATKFGDKFRGVVSFTLGEDGVELKIERPAVQLFFYLGLCYQKTGQHEKAITCWSYILTGSAGSKGGNAFAWDSLGVAISNEDAEAVRGLLYVLLNRALEYSSARNPEASRRDLQQVLHYAELAEGRPGVKQIFQPLVEWVRDDLKISLTGSDSGVQEERLLDALRRVRAGD